jgi:type I restriction enzyme S subunit
MTVDRQVGASLRQFKRYPAYKNTGVEWLTKIPAHWEVVRNSQLFRERDQRGRTDLPILEVSIASGVRVREFSDTKIEQRSNDLRAYKVAAAGDIAFNKMRMWQGAVGVAPECGLVSPDYIVAEPRTGVDPAYYSYVFRTPLYMAEVYRWSHGIVDDRNRLYWDDFKAIRSPAPPFTERRAIVAFVDREKARIDALVANKERLIELLQEKRIARITQAVTEGLDPNVAMKDAGVQWIREIPAHWNVKRLWHLTPSDRRIMYGIVLPGPNVQDGVPIIKGRDISTERLRLNRLNRTTLEIESGYLRSRVRSGDLVYAIRGSIGEVAIVPDELEGANLTQDAARISYTPATHGLWLLHMLKSAFVFAQLEAGALGATISGVNIRDLKRASIPVPRLAEQQAIAGFLRCEIAKIDALAMRIREAIDRLKEFRTALILAAVTGEIDVRDETV